MDVGYQTAHSSHVVFYAEPCKCSFTILGLLRYDFGVQYANVDLLIFFGLSGLSTEVRLAEVAASQKGNVEQVTQSPECLRIRVY